MKKKKLPLCATQIKAIVATALVVSLAVPATSLTAKAAATSNVKKVTAKETVQVPAPISTIDFESGFTADPVKETNPFANLDLSETYDETTPYTGSNDSVTGWSKGVSISYWVKAATNTDGEAVDSNLIVFNNTSRSVIQRDDYAKYLACQNYSETDPQYSLGTQSIMTDADGKTYNVYQDYGCLIRLNPNYPLDTEASEKGGWYIPTKASDAKIDVTDADGKKFKIASLAMGTTVDTGLYESYSKLYNGSDDDTYSTKSKIRQEVIKGSMQISAQNDFHFREDSYRTETTYDENGIVVSSEAVDGSVITNPNSTEYNQIQDFEGANQFYFDGDETVTQNSEEWHYVTFVIQNDLVDVYVDGEFKDPEEFFGYCKDETGESFSKQNAGKMFNQGRGIRGIFAFDKNNVADWPATGTCSASPANALGVTMLDWLSDANTELYLGGNGVASACMSQDIGTAEGTGLDDIAFYDVPLNEEEAAQAYANAVYAKEHPAVSPSPSDGPAASDDPAASDNPVTSPSVSVEPSEVPGDSNVSGGSVDTDATQTPDASAAPSASAAPQGDGSHILGTVATAAKTADSAQIALLLVILSAAGATVAVIYTKKKSKKVHE